MAFGVPLIRAVARHIRDPFVTTRASYIMGPLNMRKPPKKDNPQGAASLHGARGQDAGREGASLNQLCLSNRFLFISGLKSLPAEVEFPGR